VVEAVAEAQAYVQQEAVIHSDETGFRQGNSDGQNTAKKRGCIKRQLFWPVRVNYFGRFLSSAKARCLAVC
jgi:hypothetical protein